MFKYLVDPNRAITRIYIRIAMVIIFIEIMVMFFFSSTPFSLKSIINASFNAGLISVFSTPLIYFWIVAPFIQERNNAVEQIQHLVLHDSLTGLANQRLFEEHLDRTIELCRRDKIYGALMLINLDGFKPINDEYGHSAGDALLKNVASSLVENLRNTDIAARFDGDEFIILFGHAGKDKDKSVEIISMVAKKLRKKIRETINIAGSSFDINASIGIRIIEPEDEDVKVLIHDVDMALYAAKKAGGAQVRLFQYV